MANQAVNLVVIFVGNFLYNPSFTILDTRIVARSAAGFYGTTNTELISASKAILLSF